MNHHATAISWNNKGLIFTGPPGCGKSSLAYELIRQGAILVADDQVILNEKNGSWYAICPQEIKNKLYIRDTGFLHFDAQDKVIIDLIFQSDQTAFPLSQPPKLGVPVIEMDFHAPDAKQLIVNALTLFDSPPLIP